MTLRIRSRASALLALGLLLLAAPAAAKSLWTRGYTYVPSNWNVWAYPRMAADVDGDGLDDIVGFAHGSVSVARSTGVGVAAGQTWLDAGPVQGYGWRVESHPRMMGDVNGDGLADIVAFGHEGTYVWLSNGASFVPAGLWIADFGVQQGWTVRYHDRAVADVNGDGYDDIIGFGGHHIMVSLSGPGGASPYQHWSTELTAQYGYDSTMHSRQVADVDGDGLADAVAFDHYGVLVAYSTGSGFGPARRVLNDFGYQQRGDTANAPRLVADVDGDGLADLLTIAPEGVLMARSRGIDGWGNPAFDPMTLILRDYGPNHGWNWSHLRTMGDLDGDGRADLIGFEDTAVRVALSRGNRFDNDFDPLTGGEYVTRFEQTVDGRCLNADGDLPRGYGCSESRAFGWILQPRGGSRYALVQEGRCLHLGGGGSTQAFTTAAGCADPTAEWFVERDREGRVRLRNAALGGCLEYGRSDDWPHVTRTYMCDASDNQLWNVPSLRPRTFATSLRLKHSGQCVTMSGWNQPLRQRYCDGRASQMYDAFDDGQGRLRFRSHADPNLCIAISSTSTGWNINTMYCVEGSPWEYFAVEDLGNNHRLLVSQHSGHCLDLRGSQQNEGADILSWDCTGTANQQVTMPGAIADVPMEISLQNVGSPTGTELFIAHRAGGFRTRDPAAIVKFLTRSGQYTAQEVYDLLLTVPQQAEYDAQLQQWGGSLPGVIDAQAEVLSISAQYNVGPDGVELEIETWVAEASVEIAGVAHANAKVLTTGAEITVRDDGFALSPAADVIAAEGGFGDPDGSYAGVAGGVGSRGFSVAARWGQDGQYGVTVPLAVVSVSVYVDQDDAIMALSFANDIGAWMAFATLDAFDSAWGWSSGAYDTAASAVSNLFDDIGSFIGDVAAGARVLGSLFSWF